MCFGKDVGTMRIEGPAGVGILVETEESAESEMSWCALEGSGRRSIRSVKRL
jgi:hypothetical protein